MYSLRRSLTGKTWIVEDSRRQAIAMFYSEELANKFLKLMSEQ